MFHSIKQRFATPFIRRILNRPTLDVARRRLSHNFVRGEGIEIGGLNFPLEVLPGVRVTHADVDPNVDEGKFHALEATVIAPDFYTDIETMNGVANDSQDFVIANHVLEHVEDPLRAIRSVSRVLKQGGIAFMALPNKRFSFDRPREITSLQHIIEDYERGPEQSRRAHYVEWVERVEQVTPSERSSRVALMMAQRTNIHFHVWDYAAMRPFFDYATSAAGMTVEHAEQNRSEAIWILRKSTTGSEIDEAR